MHLSMKTRIFSIVGIMLLVTMIVVGASFYGISRLIGTMDNIGRQGRRTVILERIDKVVLNRRIATTDVIMTAAEADMKKIIDGPFAQLPKAMEDELAEYLATSPVPVLTAIRERHDAIQTLWAEYMKQTDAVVALSYANSNNKALAVNEGLQDFWDSLDAGFLRLEELVQHGGKDAEDAAAKVETGRVSLLRFRLNLSKYLPEEDPARSRAFQRTTEEYFQVLHDVLGELARTRPAAAGGAMAADLLCDNRTQDQIKHLQRVKLEGIHPPHCKPDAEECGLRHWSSYE